MFYYNPRRYTTPFICSICLLLCLIALLFRLCSLFSIIQYLNLVVIQTVQCLPFLVTSTPLFCSSQAVNICVARVFLYISADNNEGEGATSYSGLQATSPTPQGGTETVSGELDNYN